MNKVFKIGLIGCGHIAETYFRAEKYFNNIKIIKCADINDKASKRCALNFGINVYIFCPFSIHFSLIRGFIPGGNAENLKIFLSSYVINL